MNYIFFFFVVVPLFGNSEFVVSNKDREQKRLAKLSYARLKEELVCRCDPTIKIALNVLELLANYQKMVVTTQLSTTVLIHIADLQKALSEILLLLVNGVSDLAQDGKQTNFGKAGKKELQVYCNCCGELELLLEDILQSLTQCRSIKQGDELKKNCHQIADKLLVWRQEIEKRARLI